MENLPGTKWAADGRLVCSVAQKRIQPGRGVLAVLNTCLIDPSSTGHLVHLLACLAVRASKKLHIERLMFLVAEKKSGQIDA
jgi:hypothetical protein